MGGKRCVRSNVYTNELYEQKLKLLANSCNLAYLTLGSMIVCGLLDSPSFVYYLQKNLNTVEHYWITADYDQNKKVIYKQEIITTENRKIKKTQVKYLDFLRPRRLKFSYSNDHDSKLSLLSRSCNLSKSELAAFALHYGLDNSHIIMQLQKQHNIHKHFWVTPVAKDGIISYVFLP